MQSEIWICDVLKNHQSVYIYLKRGEVEILLTWMGRDLGFLPKAQYYCTCNRHQKVQTKTALRFHVSALNKALFWMYCTYENKYKLWRDLWLTVVTPPPLIVTSSCFSVERMADCFYFGQVVRNWAGLFVLLEIRSCFRHIHCRTCDKNFYCYVLPRFKVWTVMKKSHCFVCRSRSWVSVISRCVSTSQLVYFLSFQSDPWQCCIQALKIAHAQ